MELTTRIARNLLDRNYAEHVPFVDMALEMFELIKDLQKMKGWAFAKLKWIAQRFNISKRYAQKVLKVLRDTQLIEVRRREKNYYRLNPLLTQSGAKERDTSTDKKQVQREAAVSKTISEIEPQSETKEVPIAQEIAQEIAEQIEAAPPEDPAEDLTVAPEVKQAVEEAAKEVKKESINSGKRRPPANHYYADVMRLLAEWKIEAPRQLVGDVVLQRWQSWF
jgi:Mn-dependent DtxR family transcriptional regulator